MVSEFNEGTSRKEVHVISITDKVDSGSRSHDKQSNYSSLCPRLVPAGSTAVCYVEELCTRLRAHEQGTEKDESHLKNRAVGGNSNVSRTLDSAPRKR